MRMESGRERICFTSAATTVVAAAVTLVCMVFVRVISSAMVAVGAMLSLEFWATEWYCMCRAFERMTNRLRDRRFVRRNDWR